MLWRPCWVPPFCTSASVDAVRDELNAIRRNKKLADGSTRDWNAEIVPDVLKAVWRDHTAHGRVLHEKDSCEVFYFDNVTKELEPTDKEHMPWAVRLPKYGQFSEAPLRTRSRPPCNSGPKPKVTTSTSTSTPSTTGPLLPPTHHQAFAWSSICFDAVGDHLNPGTLASQTAGTDQHLEVRYRPILLRHRT